MKFRKQEKWSVLFNFKMLHKIQRDPRLYRHLVILDFPESNNRGKFGLLVYWLKL